jgi:peptide deformylase
MSLRDIIIYPDRRLREKCAAVAKVDARIRQLLADMAETMYTAPGIGLAASQVGVLDRVIVVDVGADEESGRQARLYKLVNPAIIEREGEIEMEEGCLSIPDIRDVVRRSASVVVDAFDENGDAVQVEAEGLLSVCLQHEIDHLDGVLFIDRLSNIKREILRSKLKKLKQTTKPM